jgi:hypothetical protein
MTLVVKSVVAFCIGIFVVVAAQGAGLFSLKQYLQSERAMTAGVPVMGGAIPNATMSSLNEGSILPQLAAIDTSTGQRLAIEGVARRTDLQFRAVQSATPMPVRIPGLR